MCAFNIASVAEMLAVSLLCNADFWFCQVSGMIWANMRHDHTSIAPSYRCRTNESPYTNENISKYMLTFSYGSCQFAMEKQKEAAADLALNISRLFFNRSNQYLTGDCISVCFNQAENWRYFRFHLRVSLWQNSHICGVNIQQNFTRCM